MRFQVRDGAFQQVNAVINMAEHCVAVKAQDASRALGSVVVVKMQRYAKMLALWHIILVASANFATVTSAFAKRIVVGAANAVLVLTGCIGPFEPTTFRIARQAFSARFRLVRTLFRAPSHFIFSDFTGPVFSLFGVHIRPVSQWVSGATFVMPLFLTRSLCHGKAVRVLRFSTSGG